LGKGERGEKSSRKTQLKTGKKAEKGFQCSGFGLIKSGRD
jgi:hypothetical protein